MTQQKDLPKPSTNWFALGRLPPEIDQLTRKELELCSPLQEPVTKLGQEGALQTISIRSTCTIKHLLTPSLETQSRP